MRGIGRAEACPGRAQWREVEAGRRRAGRALAPPLPPPGSSATAADDDQAALGAHAPAVTLTRALPPPKQKARARAREFLKGTQTQKLLFQAASQMEITEGHSHR